MPIDASNIANLNGLVILNSAFFAIAQYTDKRHVDMIKSLIDEVKSADLTHLDKVKPLWEKITNLKPTSNYVLIVSYLVTYVLYALTHMLIQICSDMSYFVNLYPPWMTILSVWLFLSAMWLVKQLHLMHSQLKGINKDKESFYLQISIWDAASKALSSA